MTTLARPRPAVPLQPGTLAFLIVFGMAVVLIFLFRSMSKHLRKVNAAARRDEASAEAPGGPAKDPVGRHHGDECRGPAPGFLT